MSLPAALGPHVQYSLEELGPPYKGFTSINGGPEFKFNEAISFLITCETQEEMLANPNDERAKRAMQAMMQMRRIDLAALREAADAVPAS